MWSVSMPSTTHSYPHAPPPPRIPLQLLSCRVLPVEPAEGDEQPEFEVSGPPLHVIRCAPNKMMSISAGFCGQLGAAVCLSVCVSVCLCFCSVGWTRRVPIAVMLGDTTAVLLC